MNINLLRQKRDIVIKYIKDVKPLIIAISETSDIIETEFLVYRHEEDHVLNESFNVID